MKPRGYTENPTCDMKSIPGEFIDRLTERTHAQSLTFCDILSSANFSL